jgi:hypothetical protein
VTRGAALPGRYVCDCNNAVAIEDVVIFQKGSIANVQIWPEHVRCGGCGAQMNIRYEEGDDGELPSVHGRDHMGGAPERGEDPAGRARAEGLGATPLSDQELHRPAADRAGERAGTEAGDGGSPRDLPPAARHLAIGGTYVLKQGEYQDCLGELTDIDATEFGFAYGVLDVQAADGVAVGVRLSADFLEPYELDA